jgi:hypothetical protein
MLPTRRYSAWLTLLTCLFARQLWAGVPECGNVRLEDSLSCRIRGNLDCSASCNGLGIYKKACATKLHTVCREECTLSADPACTDSCTEMCAQDCDRGVNVICLHNCFGECTGACETKCPSANDPETCFASCRATCDGECDVRCRPVVEASCYTHCVECCGGSCQARANMDCQTRCQEETFEQCEYELKGECDVSCDANGALFCDGEYVLSGREIPACLQALYTRGLGNVDLNGSGMATASAGASSGCAFAGAPSRCSWSAGGLPLLALVVLLRSAARRRPHAHFTST